jgi:hypothetical protein
VDAAPTGRADDTGRRGYLAVSAFVRNASDEPIRVVNPSFYLTYLTPPTYLTPRGGFEIRRRGVMRDSGMFKYAERSHPPEEFVELAPGDQYVTAPRVMQADDDAEVTFVFVREGPPGLQVKSLYWTGEARSASVALAAAQRKE